MSCDDKWHSAIPQCATAGPNISANLDPPSHSLFVLPPLVPKSRFELPLFAPHHKPHERPMDDSEYNAAEAIGDRVSLSRKHNDLHLAAVKMIRRPHSQKKAGRK